MDDLHKFRVVTIHDTGTSECLNSYYIHFNPTDSIEEGLEHLLNETTDIFVYDEPLMRFEIERLELNKKIYILPYTLRKD